MMRKRAVAYTRMRDFTVLDRECADFQVKEIMLYADDNGYRVIRAYRDLPDRGLNFHSGLADLAADAKKGQFDVVLVYDRRQLYASWWKRWWYMLTLWLRTGVTVKRMDSHYGRRLARLASTTKPAVAHDRGSTEEWGERWKLEPIELDLRHISEVIDNEPVQLHCTLSKKSPDETLSLLNLGDVSCAEPAQSGVSDTGDISESVSLYNIPEDKD